jgi:hypothetical protein
MTTIEALQTPQENQQLNFQLQTHTPKQDYLKSLTIENVKCFKGEQTLDLSDDILRIKS